jgi:hypothetical protein
MYDKMTKRRPLFVTKESLVSVPIPPKPPKSFRVTLEINSHSVRLDNVLLAALKSQTENSKLQAISRTQFKELFREGKVQIKGQNARPSSSLTRGITYVDILS